MVRVLLSEADLKSVVRKTVAVYNRFRSPEAFAKVVLVTPDLVVISFSGSFCYSCGVLDYIEDFIHEFQIFTDKVELKIGKTRQTSSRSFEADFFLRSR